MKACPHFQDTFCLGDDQLFLSTCAKIGVRTQLFTNPLNISGFGRHDRHRWHGPPLHRKWYVLRRSACGWNKVKCWLADPRKGMHGNRRSNIFDHHMSTDQTWINSVELYWKHLLYETYKNHMTKRSQDKQRINEVHSVFIIWKRCDGARAFVLTTNCMESDHPLVSKGDLWSTSACHRNLRKSCLYNKNKQIQDGPHSVLVGRESFDNNICYFSGNWIKLSDANINAGIERQFHVQINVSQNMTNLWYVTDVHV
jgi:hypothetical protein